MEGYENGPSVVTFADGKREERNYEGGNITGPAIVLGPKGQTLFAGARFSFTPRYLNEKHQNATIYLADLVDERFLIPICEL